MGVAVKSLKTNPQMTLISQIFSGSSSA